MTPKVLIAAALHVLMAAVILGYWRGALVGFLGFIVLNALLLMAGLGYVLWVALGEADANGDPERDATLEE